MGNRGMLHILTLYSQFIPLSRHGVIGVQLHAKFVGNDLDRGGCIELYGALAAPLAGSRLPNHRPCRGRGRDVAGTATFSLYSVYKYRPL